MEDKTSYFKRVIGNESTKRGMAAAAAGLLVAGIMEAFWPSA